ncbi:MAG: Gfo/Idh/MocA family oxidoreductase [Saprospiraceae bacterium]
MNPINTALCSFGMSGTVFHAPFLTLHPGFKLYAVWERNKNLSREKYPDVKVYRTIEEILSDPEVELVVVNTPSYTHYEYAKQVLLAGKNAIVEKPFTATVAQAKEIVQLARTKNVQLSVFQNRRYDSDFMTVQDIIQLGVLGDILEAELHYDRYNLILSPKPHKETPGPAVGCIYDLGPHLIDQALTLFGMPEKVFADLMMTRPGSRVNDYFEILLYYPTMRTRLKAGYQVREPFPSFVIHGSKGSFLKSRADVQETHLQAHRSPSDENWGLEDDANRGLLHTEINGEVIRKLVPTFRGNYLKYYDSIFNALRHGMAPAVTGEDGVRIITIIEAAQKSSDEKKVIDL